MMRKLLFAALAVVMATTAFATSGDYQDVVIPQDPYTWEGQLPAYVLVIQDQWGWGFNTHVEIMNAYGVAYDVINSGQIAAHDFYQYDKILTVGQQPDAYYYAIEADRQKFEDFMDDGGCCSFETANYFGYANEYITWPGGFMAQINQGANIIAIDDAGSPLMTDPNAVTEAELQGWNYSAHGIHVNLPGSYSTVLTTVDGSPPGTCAGTFTLGAGGAAICHQPIEWGYGFGYSLNYVPNFDLYTCGAPIATESTSWGSVKSLYR
jgi:hypothetical protein